MSLRRPLTAAVAAAGRGRFVLDGVARMRERPIQDLVDGLVQLGVQASCTLGTGCPPVEVLAKGLPSGTVRRCPKSAAVPRARQLFGARHPANVPWSGSVACAACASMH